MGAVTRPAPAAARGLVESASTSPARRDAVRGARSQEKALIRAARRGDREAFGAIIMHHQGVVFGHLRARLIEPADAEDLCQEVFLRCISGKANFDRTTRLRPWLIGIARNVLREHVRKVRRRKEVAWTELCLELDDMVADDNSNHEDAMAHLPGCIRSLGQSAREALELRYHACLRLAEIGKRLHRSEGAIKLLMYRARQALKNCLDGKMRSNADE